MAAIKRATDEPILSQESAATKASHYAEVAKEITQKLVETRRMSIEYENNLAKGDRAIEDQQYGLDELEAEIKRRTHELAKHREKALKRREKASKKMSNVETKRLEEVDGDGSDADRTLSDELEALKYEAKRVADEIAEAQRLTSEYAELKEHEFIKAEMEARQIAKELSQHQREDWQAIEKMLRDLSIKKDSLIRKVKALTNQLELSKQDLEEYSEALFVTRQKANSSLETANKLRSEVKVAEKHICDLTESDTDAHAWLEQLRQKESRIHLFQENEEDVADEIAKAINTIKSIAEKKQVAEQKLKKLSQQELDAARKADFILAKADHQRDDVETEEQKMLDTTTQLALAEKELQAVRAEKRRVHEEAVEFRKSAAEATAKAKELAGTVEIERKEAQAKLQDVVAEEHEAIQEAFQLGKALKL